MTIARHPPKVLDRHPPRRAGITLIEVLVSFTLLTTVLATTAPLLVRHNRLLASGRQYRLGLDELNNQLERLTRLPEQERQSALQQLTPSAFAAERLRNAKLSAQTSAAEPAQRLTLRLEWGEPGPTQQSLSLSAWIFPQPAPSAP